MKPSILDVHCTLDEESLPSSRSNAVASKKTTCVPEKTSLALGERIETSGGLFTTANGRSDSSLAVLNPSLACTLTSPFMVPARRLRSISKVVSGQSITNVCHVAPPFGLY